jgi:hypothetical protein
VTKVLTLVSPMADSEVNLVFKSIISVPVTVTVTVGWQRVKNFPN